MYNTLPLISSVDPAEGLTHLLIVALSAMLVVISSLAYLRRLNTRYMLLTAAFVFLFLSQLVTTIEVILLSDSILTVPGTNIHLTSLFDLLMLMSFAFALVREWPPRTDKANGEENESKAQKMSGSASYARGKSFRMNLGQEYP